MRWTIAVVLVGAVGVAASADPPTKAEIARATKPAVAIVHTDRLASSATCLSPRGYFLTVATAVSTAGRDRTVTVVLNGGEKDERVLAGRVLRIDPTLGLAIVKVDAEGPFAAVAMGDESAVGELDEVIAFSSAWLEIPEVNSGTPRPLKAPTLKYGGNVVSKLQVTSLQRVKGALTQIVLERSTQLLVPGGPVMDLTGKMVGILGADTASRGLNPLIPANVLRAFLARPEMSLAAADADPAKKHDPMAVRASVFALRDAPDDEEVELAVRSGGRERRIEMKRTDSGYEAVVAPFEKSDIPSPVQVEVKYPDGTVRGGMADRTFTVGGKAYNLSKVAGVRFGKWPGVQLPGGASVGGEVKGLDELPVMLGDKPLPLLSAGIRELVVVPVIEPDGGFRFSAVIRRGGKEVGRAEALHFLKGSVPWGLDGLRVGRLTKPPEGEKPVTYAVAAGAPGEKLTEGQTLTFDPALITAVANTGTGGTEITLGLHRNYFNTRLQREDSARCTLAVAGQSGEPLEAKEYPKVVELNYRHWVANAAGVGFDLGGSNTRPTGKFAVWEVEIAADKKKVAKLAFDAILYLDNHDEPVFVTVRFNSRFK